MTRTAETFKTSPADQLSVSVMKIRFGYVEIVTADMAASLAFYRALGVSIPEDAVSEPHVEADLWGVKVSWDTEEMMASFDPSFRPAAGTGRVSLALDLGTPEAVDTLYRAVTEAGFTGHLAPLDAFWGQRYAVLHDPDGNTIDLYARLATGTQ